MKYFKDLLLLFFFLCSFPSCNRTPLPELHVFIWSDYIKPELIKKFEKTYHCRVIVDTYDSNESMYAKLKLGALNYDILFPSNYFLDLMVDQNMLQPIDTSFIPNGKNIDPIYLKLAGAVPNEYGIPYMVSNTGIAYRKDRVKEFEPSWGIFARTDLKGRMTMLNDIREAIGAGLKYLGFSINTTNPDEINKAVDQLIEWKRNLAKFESEQYKNGIASAEFLVVQGYAGDILQVMQENQNVDFAYPQQGMLMSIDYLTIPKDAHNVELAHQFINFLLDGDIAAENMAFGHHLSPNIAAYDKLPPELRSSPVLFPSEKVLLKSEIIQNLGKDDALYNQAWDKIKAAD
jgi:spermidine/putrescine transport system substrate-binding protein